MTGLAWPGPVLRRPPAIVGVDTESMPRVTDAVQLLPVVRPHQPGPVAAPALDLTWSALDLLLLPVAAWLMARDMPARHRRRGAVVRRRGIDLRADHHQHRHNATGDPA
ncbi:hypothetical protein O7627_24235 [Solwaraspora sp. WMMD1047]|uniref:hypothetical protein n=1 Tax=Solwaraspora sp. WMMD1047 TaxID=3016102 RepID=UPI002415C394|nr:hypothetical protein [Solwaraspora sp. WMMD1047]MDG4832392.1 hypothetical protein [Solwaraspora sp. WMMD1047]